MTEEDGGVASATHTTVDGLRASSDAMSTLVKQPSAVGVVPSAAHLCTSPSPPLCPAHSEYVCGPPPVVVRSTWSLLAADQRGTAAAAAAAARLRTVPYAGASTPCPGGDVSRGGSV